MQVPASIAALLRLRRCFGLALLFVVGVASSYARGPQPNLRIPLDSLGFQTLNAEFLADGSSMLTLHFIDEQHLLVTFNAHTLLKRIPDDPPTDQDRNVAALLLELPSGRVLARTEWRLHDHGQYLWSLGHGRFLLRIRDTLTTVAPLANLATDEPFHQRPFLSVVDRRIGAIILTPDADFLILETKAPTPVSSQPADLSPTFSKATELDPVQINFYRISIPPGPGEDVLLASAGSGRSQTFGNISLTTAGHLDIIDQGHHSWAFNFDTFTGKIKELAPFDSSCSPSPIFVSHSEFIAFGCRGPQGPPIVGGFNMRGEEMWEQGLFGNFTAPYLVFAPASGRFAFGRVMTSLPVTAADTISAEEFSSQDVVVYQTDSGRQILKVDCSPIERAGQNFALSPDGLSFGVFHEGAIEIYKLPPLTAKEQAAVKLAQESAPEETDLPVHLAARESSAPSTEKKAVAQPEVPPASQSTSASRTTGNASSSPAGQTDKPAAPATPAPQSATTAAAQSASGDTASGDTESNQPRKPPTLYTLPTDPQGGQSSAQPK